MFTSARGQVLVANAAARLALGLAEERPTACDFAALFADSPAKLADTLRSWASSSAPTPGAFTLRAEGTTTFNAKGCVIVPATVDTSAVLLVRFWRRAEANPFLLLNQKITELNDEVARRAQAEEALRRSETALRERADEAEALNRSKDEFLATVSHELRTPLNAILGWSTLLRRRAGSDEQLGKGLQVIQRNAESQAKIIDDILDVSRIITGKLILETLPTDLLAIIEDAIEVVRPSAAAKEITLVVPPPSEACVLIADSDRIRQTVWNLLSNAVKFTDRGGEVRVEVSREGSRFVLVVSDTGKGIEPAFLPFVFDRFKQADSSITRRAGGLGLGLAIVRHIVELHGGAVEAFSEGPGRGATFTVTLPIRAITTTAVTPEPKTRDQTASQHPAPSALHGLRVLVVDDEPDARELLAAVLTQAGGEVDTAGSAAEALEQISQFRPHVLVSDVGMPDEDGYSLIRRLRKRDVQQGGAIPAVALTAYTRAEDRSTALAAGFTTHIGKPVNPDDLLATIAHLAALARW